MVGAGLYIDPRLSNESISFYNSPANEIYNWQKFHDENNGIKRDDKVNQINYERLKLKFNNRVRGSIFWR